MRQIILYSVFSKIGWPCYFLPKIFLPTLSLSVRNQTCICTDSRLDGLLCRRHLSSGFSMLWWCAHHTSCHWLLTSPSHVRGISRTRQFSWLESFLVWVSCVLQAFAECDLRSVWVCAMTGSSCFSRDGRCVRWQGLHAAHVTIGWWRL